MKFFKLKKEGEDYIAQRMWGITAEVLLVFGAAFLFSIILMNAKAKKDSEIRESETLINGVSSNISASIDNYKDITRLVMLNDKVCTFLRAEKATTALINDADMGMWDVLNVCNGLDSVFLFRNDGDYVNTGKGLYFLDTDRMESEEWLDAINSKRGGAVISMNGNSAIFRQRGEQIVTISRAVYDIYTQKQTGILLMNISTNALEKIMLAQGNASIAVFSTEGKFLAGDTELEKYYDDDFIAQEIVHKKKGFGTKRAMISGAQIENYPLIILCRNDDSGSFLPLETIFAMLSLLAAFVISFVVVTDYINHLISSLLEKEKVAQRAEMNALHEQIKPHFLYNSLETISYMALEAGADNVHDVLETLGSFYRNFLSKGDREIPFRREVSIIRDYLSIQRLRYGDILMDEYDIAEDTLDIRIPKLTLQPIVENCIYHGIRPKGEPGTISVKSFKEHGEFHIIVRDTGVGMTEEQIEKLLCTEKSDDSEKLSGFGLRGTIERIRYYSGKDDVISIRSEVGEYTEIEIVIPIS